MMRRVLFILAGALLAAGLASSTIAHELAGEQVALALVAQSLIFAGFGLFAYAVTRR